MYGIPTPAGTKAYQDKTYNRTSYDTPDQLEIDLDKAFEVTSPDIGDPEDYSYNDLSSIENTTPEGYDPTGGGSGSDSGGDDGGGDDGGSDDGGGGFGGAGGFGDG